MRISFLFVLFLMIGVRSQDFDWSKPTDFQRQLETVSFEPGASAVILHEKGEMTVDNSELYFIVKRRIKVLSKDGFKHAEIRLPYYSNKGFQDIIKVKAHTINDDEIIELDEKSVYEVDINELWSEKRFSFPAVQIGSILEYEYRLVGKNLTILEPWSFQHEIPTLVSELEFINNMALEYTYLMQGEKLVEYENEKEKDRPYWRLINLPSNKTVRYVHNAADYIEQIRFQLSSNEYSGIDVANNWDRFTKDISGVVKEKARKSKVRNYLDELQVQGNGEDKFNQILKLFDSRFKWNGFYAITPRLNSSKLLDENMGNSADLNLFLNQLLVESGLDAKLVMISHRKNGKLSTAYPLIDQFSHFINLVDLAEEGKYLVDAIDIDVLDPRYLRIEDCNYFGFLLDKNVEEQWVTINMMPSSIIDKQKIDFNRSQNQFSRLLSLEGYFRNSRKWKPDMAVKLTGGEFEEQEMPFENQKQNIRFKGSFKSLSTNDIFVIENPLIEKLNHFNELASERKRPIEIDFPFYLQTTVYFKMSDNQEAIVPENFKVNYLGGAYSYAQSAVISGQQLAVIYEYQIAEDLIAYDDLEGFIEFQKIVKQAIKQKPIIKPKD